MWLYQINIMLSMFILTQICCVRSVIPFTSSCPTNVTAMDNFDIKQFLGVWFVYSRYPFFNETEKGSCESVEYLGHGNESYEIIKYDIDRLSGVRRSNSIKIKKVTRHGKFAQVRSNKIFPLGVDVWVLDTDYDTYAVRYLCIDVPGSVHFKWAAIFSRDHVSRAWEMKKAVDALKSRGIDVTKLNKVDNTACPVA